jgi:hypothetical protein
VHAWLIRGRTEHRLDEEARRFIGARHASERRILAHEVLHHARMTELLPVHPRAPAVENEYPWVA